MQFGMGNKPQEVDPAELEPLLNSLLDKKISNFGAKASNIVKEMSKAKNQFSEACSRFEELNSEPNKLNIYIDNINFIKSQKNFYSKSLRHIIDNWDVSDVDAPNMHIKYSSILSNTERFVAEILKSNNGFKKMLYSYSDHLDSFKRSFSYIERLRDSLVNELNKIWKELSEYNSINEQILQFNLWGEDLIASGKNIDALNQYMTSGSTGAIDTEELEISKGISDRKGELKAVSGEASSLTNRISSIATQLERPARKFDHVSSRKRQLYEFIADPVNTIKNESDYREFASLLEELGKSVDSGLIDTKNSAKTRESISELLNMDIYDEIANFKILERKKSDLEGEIRHSEIMLSKLKEDKNNSERAVGNIESLKRSVVDIGIKRDQTKDKICALFMNYYNKRITIKY